MTEVLGREFEESFEAAGRRIAALLDGVSAVAVIGNDPIATAAAAVGVARDQALHRRVFLADMLGEGSPLNHLSASADHGLSDMIRYGVSLGKAAVPQPESPNLFAISGGADSPLIEEVLTSARWRSLSDLAHAAGALLLVAAPANVPGLDSALRHLDGALLVEGAVSPGQGIRTLGEIRVTSERAPLAIPEPASAVIVDRRMPRWLIPLGAAALLALGVWLTPLRDVVSSLWRTPAPGENVGAAPAAPLPEIPPPTPRVQSDAAWSVEFLFTNSEADAVARVASVADSLPAATFSAPMVGADSATWHRLVSGAFSDSLSAENFLTSLRSRGVLATGGVVLYTPFAFLLDSALDNSLLPVKISAYRGRGIPAYALRDATGVWRIYAGAFAALADGALLKRRLDSLNIQSTLLVRVGSTS